MFGVCNDSKGVSTWGRWRLSNNQQRIKSPSQIAREGMELQRIESERAKGRMEAGKEVDPDLNSDQGRTLDHVAASLGISRDRWYKLKTVFERAESGGCPGVVRGMSGGTGTYHGENHHGGGSLR
jgi:hypothetical protein